MESVSPLLTTLALAYGAAAAGAGCAILARFVRRGRQPSAAEATWAACLPLLFVLLLPVVTAMQPHAVAFLHGPHGAWHHWQEAVRGSPVAHAGLHVGNLLFLAFVGGCWLRAAYRLGRSRALVGALRQQAVCDAANRTDWPVYTVPGGQAACFTVGVLRPAIYVSASLRARVSPRDYEAMLAHESAHLRRRDGLTGALLSAFFTLFPVPGSRVLRADWERAAERACDAAAALSLGSPCDVAAALIQVARLVRHPLVGMPEGIAFTRASGEDVEGRVRSLLALSLVHAPQPEGRVPLGFLAASLVTLFAASFWLHHLVELFVRH